MTWGIQNWDCLFRFCGILWIFPAHRSTCVQSYTVGQWPDQMVVPHLNFSWRSPWLRPTLLIGTNSSVLCHVPWLKRTTAGTGFVKGLRKYNFMPWQGLNKCTYFIACGRLLRLIEDPNSGIDKSYYQLILQRMVSESVGRGLALAYIKSNLGGPIVTPQVYSSVISTLSNYAYRDTTIQNVGFP